MLKKDIIIYTDGACKGNPGPGGWGVVIYENDKIKKELAGYKDNTTNNVMEITAAIKALEYFKVKKQVIIFTDSNYLKLGITEWIYTWKRKKWTNSKKKPIKNLNLWQSLDSLNNFHLVEWKWVKAHNGDPGNERADFLATSAIK